MIVERLTYAEAAARYDDAATTVEELEHALVRARRALRLATAEMHHALYLRLDKPLP